MTLRPVRKGAEYTRQARDSIGFVRDKAPADGFAWNAGEECGFVSLREMETAMVGLKMLQRGGRR